ncbi:hypothetical protein GCM10010361_65760 [Streptomyces olivaceiscleroticus]|uniref:Uncharacterized protein n=1 Tax=Streptomyces olivaceiscleroticus TaxID=68245 RepID=A0ABN1B6N7_9ACTN
MVSLSVTPDSAGQRFSPASYSNRGKCWIREALEVEDVDRGVPAGLGRTLAGAGAGRGAGHVNYVVREGQAL